MIETATDRISRSDNCNRIHPTNLSLSQLPDRVYLVTEKVTPLEEHRSTPDGQSQFSTAWGLHQILVSLQTHQALCKHSTLLYKVFPEVSFGRCVDFCRRLH